MSEVRPEAHWRGCVLPILEALGPRAVWVPGEDELSLMALRHAEESRSGVTPVPNEHTDVAVLSGDPHYCFVHSCLKDATRSGVGGDLGPPVIVVGATGWPHDRRDGYSAPDRVPAALRRAYARCLPDPDQHWLSAESASMAYALEPGGPQNGVRAAIDAAITSDDWTTVFLEGFGGIAVLVEVRRLASTPILRDVLDSVASSGGAAQPLLRELDLELGRAALAESRLSRRLAEHEATALEHQAALAAALDELDASVLKEQALVEELSQHLAGLEARNRRERRLEQQLVAAEARVTAARTELDEERRWVVAQAHMVGRSQAWRIGHRLARTARTLTFRRAGATDAVEQIATRMQRSLEGAE